MSLLTAENIAKLSGNLSGNITLVNDDVASVGSSTGSVGSVLSNKFNMNISRKMSSARTEGDVKRAMTTETRDNEDAFWAYVERKAARKMKKNAALTNVEQIAIDRKNMTVDDDGFEYLMKKLDAEYDRTGGLSKISSYRTHPLFSGRGHDFFTGFWKYASDRYNDGVDTYVGRQYVDEMDRPRASGMPKLDEDEVFDECDEIECSNERKELMTKTIMSSLSIKSTLFTDTEVESVKNTLKTGDSALTDMTLVGRYYKPCDDTEDAYYLNIARDVSVPPPEDIINDLGDKCFRPSPINPLIPYGPAWDEDRYCDMCEYLHQIAKDTEGVLGRISNDRSITDEEREKLANSAKVASQSRLNKAIIVLVHYWNRFRIYVKQERKFFEVEYDENTGFVCRMDKEWTCAAETDDLQRVARLPNSKKDTDTFPNLWKEIRGRPRVFDKVFRIAPPRRTILYNAPGINTTKVNEFLGFKAELEYDLETYPILYANDRFDISPITNFIAEKYFDNDIKYIRWFKRWLYEILWLKRRTGVAVVLYGEQGTGKTAIVDGLIGQRIMGRMVGSRSVYAKSKNFEGLSGKFNSEYQNKLLINVDEISHAKKHDALLKSLITDDINESEEKFKNRTIHQNYTNLWLTTNEEQRFLYITGDDRRYFVKEIKRWFTEKTPEITEYFNNLWDCIKHPRAPAEFMLWVKEAEGDVRDITRIPMTPEKESRIADYTDLTYYWIQNAIYDRVFVPGDVVEQKVYVDMYNDRHGNDFRASPHMFSKIFKTLGFQVVKNMPIRIKVPPLEHMIEIMKSLNKWNNYI